MEKYFRYTLYFMGFSVSTEVLYQILKLCKNYFKKQCDKGQSEINDVLFSNEFSQSCSIEHEKNKKPCKNEYCYLKNIKRITSEIDNAKESIDVAMYMFTLHEIKDALIRAHKRNVKVRIMGDESMALNDSSQILLLNDAGIPTYIVTNREKPTTMHHKFCIIDGLYNRKHFLKDDNEENVIRPTLLTGSLNWTLQGFCGNYDVIIITTNELFIDKFQKEFNRIWEKSEKRYSKVMH